MQISKQACDENSMRFVAIGTPITAAQTIYISSACLLTCRLRWYWKVQHKIVIYFVLNV